MKTILQRFMSRVKIENDGCWYWQGGITRGGYGHFNRTAKFPSSRAHVVSMMMFIGPIPEGSIVCHTCDHPDCVNPFHLFPGTPKINREDQESKGRHFFNQIRKLTPPVVLQILKADGSQREIAKQFGIKQATVSDIKSGKTWQYLTEAKKNPDSRARKLTRDVVLKIRESQGSCRDVGILYGVSPGVVSAIRTRRSWAHLG